MGSPTEDVELMTRIERGDREALRQLYRRHGARVYSLARHMLGEPERAEEVTQDVFLKAWEKASTYRSDKAQVLTWLLRVTRNRCIDVIRRDKPSFPFDEQAFSVAGPEGDVVAESEAAGVRDELARLPEAQRTVLTLAYYRGLSHTQIAKALGEPLGTVKWRIRDAFHRLRQRMER
jgi:RNA polymerase sigma-70 factor (ECF subfamily)